MSGEKNMRTAETLSGRIMVYAEIYLTIQINAFLYYLNRLPVFGKIVHSSWHSRYRLKKIWSLFSLAFGLVRSALANNIGTWILLYMIPHLFLEEAEVVSGVFLMLFILVKCVAGAMMECGLFKSSAEDYTFLTHFMVNPVSYYRYKAAKNAFFSSFMLFPVLYFLFRDWGLVGALVLMKLLCILGGNVAYLSIYKRLGRLPDKRVRRVTAYLLILLAYGGAYFGVWESGDSAGGADCRGNPVRDSGRSLLALPYGIFRLQENCGKICKPERGELSSYGEKQFGR